MLKLKETVFDSHVAPKVTDIFKNVDASKQDVVTLTTPQPVKWGRMRYMILRLPDDPFWKNTIAVTCLANFFFGTICFFFARESLMSFIPIYVICDLFYCFNLILLSLHLFWKQLKKKFFIVRVNKLVYVLDILSLLPQELIPIAIFGNNYVAIYMRWITYVRLRYLGIYFANLSRVLEKRWKNTLLAIVIYTAVALHFTTCIMYEMSCHHLRCLSLNTEEQYGGSTSTNETWYTGKWSETMVTKYPYYEVAGQFDWYLLSFYFSLEYLFNYGTNVYQATKAMEWLFFSFLMIIGYIFFGIWVLFNCFEMMVVIRRTEANYIHKVDCIKLYLRDVNVSNRVIRNIKEYFDILWQKKEGVKSAGHFYSLPNPLQMEITYDLNCVHLNNSLLLYDLKEFYLRTISLFMKHEFLLPGDILYHQGVVKTDLVIIIRGVLEILSDEDEESPILAFQAGTVLGEACLFLSLPAKATVRAAVYTEVKLIDRVDFTRNISNYPIAFSYLRERIIFRIKTRKNKMLRDDNDEDDKIPIKILKERLSRKQKGTQKSREELHTQQEGTKKMSKFCTQLLSLYKLSDFDSNIKIPEICLTYNFPFIFDSTSSMIQNWQYIVIAVHFSAIMCFTYGIIFLRNLNIITMGLLMMSDTISVVDVLLLTCTTVVMKDRVLDTYREIMAYRIKSISFYAYVISILPLSDIVEVTLSSTDFMIHQRIMDLLLGVKVLRLWRCVNILSSTLYSHKNVIYSFLSILFYIVLCTYFLGCISYLYSCFTIICTEGFWFQHLMTLEAGVNEITYYGNLFSTSLYFAANIWIRVGMGDITAVFPGDLYPILLFLFLGLVIRTLVVASFASTCYIDKTKSDAFVQRVHSFQRFLAHSRVPIDLRKQVNEHFDLQWSYDGSIGRKQFKKMAPDHLQTVVFKADLMKLLNKVPLFKFVDVDFLMHVVLSSTITLLPSHATVCYSGDVDREMFIIQKGNCKILDSGGNFVKDMKAGDYYGDIEMLFNMTKTATVRTTTNCKIMVITFRDFNSALSMFPTEMRIAHKFMYDSDLWAKVDIIEQRRMISFMQMKTGEFRKKKLLTQVMNKFTESFIIAVNCYKTSRKREKYWTPFRKLGKWKILGFCLLPITIKPEALVLKLWIGLRIFLISTMVFCLPRSVGLPPTTITIMSTLINLTELTAFLELYLFLHVAYYNQYGLLVSHPLSTAKHYLANNFLMDLAAAFPYYAIVGYIQSNHLDHLDPKVSHLVGHELYCVWRCMGLLQFYRVIGLFSYIQKDVLAKKTLIVNTILLMCVFASLLLSTIFVITDCHFKFSVLQYGDEIDESRYAIQLNEGDAFVWVGYLECQTESWVNMNTVCSQNPYNLIGCAFYWFLNLFCHMGTGDTTPYKEMDILTSLALIFYGVIAVSYILLFSATMTGESATKSIRYQQKVQELLNFLYSEDFAEAKINKVYRYFEYVWKRTIGMENREMLNELSSALKGDIALFMYEKTLREVAIFQKIARPYLKVLAKNLKEEYFLKSDNLIKSFDVHNSVYIIMRGKVDVFTPYNELIVTIGVGGLFGNIHQAAPSCSTSTFVAQRNVDALRMSSETFFLLAQEYPAINDVLFSVTNIAGDFLMPSQQSRKYHGLRSTDAMSVVSSEYEEDIYTDDIDIMSAYDREYEEIIIAEEREEEEIELKNGIENEEGNALENEEEKKKEEDEEKKKEEEEKKEKELQKEEVTKKEAEKGKDGQSSRRIIVPKNAFLVLLMFFRPKLWFKFAIEPNHRFFEYVRYITIFGAWYQLLLLPYTFLTGNFNWYVVIPSYCCEPIFYLRIFFFMHEAYLDTYGTYEKRSKKIIKHYISNYKRISWDIIPNIPFYLVCFLFSKEKRMKVYGTARLFHMTRIKYIFDAFALWSEPLLAKRGQILFFKMVFNFITFFHYIILLFMVVYYIDMEQIVAKREIFRDISHKDLYLFYFYLTANVMSSTGMGDYVPVTPLEIILTGFLTAYTKVVFAYLIVFLSTWSVIIQQHLSSYEYKVKKLIKFLENQGLSDHLTRKLWVYVKEMWKTQSGVHIPELLENAPYVLRCEIMREIYSVHLRKGYLFNGINEALLSQICGHLKRVVFFKGNYIVQNGDTNASMYWIHRGEVSVLTVHPNLTETCHEILRVHDMFGLAQGLNYGMPHRYSYRAETQCDILILKLETWESVLQHFPRDKDVIHKRMLNVYTVM
ncbi:hypothetical protein WA026_017426 [Henosepilachna vigintioctopunctata]|uniref:Cyclic nucleotide-binding domain-containing protein n=1 Tax=Henosepilachna vigintioctopunctata TaxID=420089 RepID=A0AAW1VEB0_9CUCU